MSLVGVLEVQLMAEMGRLSNDMKRAERVVGDSAEKMGASVRKLESAFGKLGGTLTLGVAFNTVRRLTDDFVKLTAQLKIATTSQADFSQGMSDVKRISTLAQADINATTFLYTRLTNALSAQGVSQKSVANITEAVGLGLKAYGATAAEASSAMLQLSQAFASNRLGGEEFRAVSESMPNLMIVLAKSMGVPRGELRALSIQGKITAAEMAKAWDNPEVIAGLTIQANMTRTITGEFIILRNNIKLLVGEFMGSSGATSGISSAIKLLSDGIGLLAKNLSSVISLVEIMTVLFVTRYAAAWVMAKRLVADHTLAIIMNTQIKAAAEAKSAIAAQSLAAATALSTGNTAMNIAAQQNSVIWTNTGTVATKALSASKAELAVATAASTKAMNAYTFAHAAATKATAANITATKVLEAATLSTFDKIKGFAKANALGLIGLALWGVYEVADHFGFIDKLSNKMGEFFNTQNAQIQKFKNLAGGGAAGEAMEKAIAKTLGDRASAEAERQAKTDMEDAMSQFGITGGVTPDTLNQLAAASRKQLDINSKAIAELGKGFLNTAQIRRLEDDISIVRNFNAAMAEIGKEKTVDKFEHSSEWLAFVDKNLSAAQERVKKIQEINEAYGKELARVQQSALIDIKDRPAIVATLNAQRDTAIAELKTPGASDRQKALNAEYSRLQDVVQKLQSKLSKEQELSESEKSALNLQQKAQKDVTQQQVYLLGLKADSLELAIKEADAMEKNANAIGKVADATKKQVLQLQRELDIFGMTKAQVRAYDSEKALALAKEYAEKLKLVGLTEDLTDEQILQVSLALDSLSYEDRRSLFAGRALEEITRNNQLLIEKGKILQGLADKEDQAAKNLLDEKFHIENAKRLQKNRLERAAADKKASEDAMELVKRFQENVQRNIGDVLYLGLQGKFKDIGDMFKQLLLRMTADAMSARLAQAMFGAGGVGAALFGTAANATTGAGITAGSISSGGMGAAMMAATPYVVGIAAAYVVAKYGFGMGNKRENVGGNRLVGEFTREGFSGNRQQSWELDRGAFRSTRSGTDLSAVSTAESRALLKTVNDLQRTFDSLGDAIGQASVRTKQWNVGMNLAGDITNALADGIGRSLVPALTSFREAGENLAQTAKRLTTIFQGTSFYINALGLSATEAFGAIGIASTRARQKLIDSTGGLDAFNQSASFFVSNFLTNAQKLAPSLDIVGRTFSQLGIVGVETNEQFAALIATQTKLASVTGDYGTVGRLLGVAEAFNNITGEAKKTTDQLLALIKTDTFSSLVDYQRAIGLASAPGVAGAGAGAMIDSATDAAVPVMAAEASAGSAIDSSIAQWDVDHPYRRRSGSSGIIAMLARQRHDRERQAYIDSLLPPMATGTNFLPRDMPVMAHEGERIIPRADNRELMSRLSNPQANNEALLSELRSLRQEVANLQAANVAIALNTNRSAKVLERFDGNGLPAEREV